MPPLKLASKIAAILWIAVVSDLGFAGLSYPGTKSVLSDDERFVLVCICPYPIEEELRAPLDALYKEEIRNIRETYPASGLYRNGEQEPLWTFDGHWNSHAIIAPDGQHVIFECEWTWDEFGLTAVEFTKRGQTIRKYQDYEVVPQWTLKAMLNGWRAPACASTSFNPAQMTYAIRTNQGEEIIFDVTTGDIIDIRSPFSIYYSIALVSVTATLSGLIAWSRKRKLASR